MNEQDEPIARELAQELARPLSLWRIEESLEGMMQARQDILDSKEVRDDWTDEEYFGALRAIDAQIEAYLSREATKVSSYAALIRREEYEAEACEREMARLKALQARHTATVDRLKETAKAVMQRFGVCELRSPTASLKLVKNGGLQPIDVNPEMVPDAYCFMPVKMSPQAWDKLRLAYPDIAKHCLAGEREVINSRIREALAQRVPCDECHGERRGSHNDPDACPKCGGAGTVPRQVPGARLLPRGERVEVR